MEDYEGGENAVLIKLLTKEQIKNRNTHTQVDLQRTQIDLHVCRPLV